MQTCISCSIIRQSKILIPFFFFNDTATTEIYTLSLHDALPIFSIAHFLHVNGFVCRPKIPVDSQAHGGRGLGNQRSEEHTSELQSHLNLVCRLLLEKIKQTKRLKPVRA